jgi:hypothetical protein
MTDLRCSIDGCEYSTGEQETVVACALLGNHSYSHVAGSRTTNQASGPKLERPQIDMGASSEEWNIFHRRWVVFRRGSGLREEAASAQLFECACATLGDALLKGDPNITDKDVDTVLTMMRQLAVIPVAIGVLRAEFVQMQQSRDELFRAFAARVRGKAETCAYGIDCTCGLTVDFTDQMTRDVLIAGIADMDIRKEILSTQGVLEKPLNDIIACVESKEMARNALPQHPVTAALSSFKKGATDQANVPQDAKKKSNCPSCHQVFSIYTRNVSGRWNYKPHALCLECFRAQRGRREVGERASSSGIGVIVGKLLSVQSECVTEAEVLSVGSSVKLTHHSFSKGQWHRARFREHPIVALRLSTDQSDYTVFEAVAPTLYNLAVDAVADSGAQSSLWALSECLEAGIRRDELLPVSVEMKAANKSGIVICGAVLLRITHVDKDGRGVETRAMTYISPSIMGFYLSCEAMVELGIIPEDFPAEKKPRGATRPASQVMTISRDANAGCMSSEASDQCECPKRTEVPKRPGSLPFKCTPGNNDKMRAWLLEKFAGSTFNTCPQRPLPSMRGPSIEIHLSEEAVPRAVHKAAMVPIHWQQKVQADLARDEALGVIEKVPYGEPVTWCHRMVLTRKQDGTPRRTVDLSPLNKFCQRETFAAESPFHMARRIPPNTWKTVTDAWNGFHSVPLRPKDRHLTTFITPFGRWRYMRAPQGYLSSGDGYNRRFDAILKDVPRKERCVDDTVQYDTELDEHWWRVIDFLRLVGEAGIVLNPDKLQFASREINFAGFRVSDTGIEPLPKYLDAIREFPVPKSLTDIRSWFGLVNQVAHYAQLRDIMAPFKPFLSPKQPFEWTDELEKSFEDSKSAIVEAIRSGVEIFDITRRTCLRPDWSKQGIGYFLSQKHCHCSLELPGCCVNGWRVTLAGSRFLTGAEARYAPVEGEALAVAWGLEQTKYFTQGCDKLLVVTDHKPLVKILGDRTLDEISNTRLFRLKQRTLPWRFEIHHLPGKTNSAADATSRYPAPASCEPADRPGDAEAAIMGALKSETAATTSITWDRMVSATTADNEFERLRACIESGFSGVDIRASDTMGQFWKYKDELFVEDGAILYCDRLVVPPSLRAEVLKALHAAHQGVTGMQARARQLVFWPGMSADIVRTREGCQECNRNAPSQAPPPPSNVCPVAATPFEAIFADFFEYQGHHYLVVGDRLSGWTEIYNTKRSTDLSGAAALVACLRSLFATFGVCQELSSDGGPEFSSSVTREFLATWGVRHRLSSAYFPQSNGRAEVAVKQAKRTLMTNMGPNGSLNSDKLLKAMLAIRNTPDTDSEMSPAQVLFGRPLRDMFAFTPRQDKFTHHLVRPVWRDAWREKESALRCRWARTLERLQQGTRALEPLKAGDRVFVQNQVGNHATKWDRSGMVVDVRDNDQYVVKVDGSGRTTLRNRRFLRRYTMPSSSLPGSSPCGIPQEPVPRAYRDKSPYSDSTSRPILPVSHGTPASMPLEAPPPEALTRAESSASPPTDAVEPKGLEARNDTVDLEVPLVGARDQVVEDTGEVRRSGRARKARVFYQPESGTWGAG